MKKVRLSNWVRPEAKEHLRKVGKENPTATQSDLLEKGIYKLKLK